ncbi:hypothetical protein BC835DRAFT_97638 [Cytidiella melzeri]|nr:hypothetical protein BC835DRAFT_97638 [Cytidiella melzeri]
MTSNASAGPSNNTGSATAFQYVPTSLDPEELIQLLLSDQEITYVHQTLKTFAKETTTRHYTAALPNLTVPILNVDTNLSDLHYNDNLLYDYAGGIALGALKRWREAEEFFEIVVSAPAQAAARSFEKADFGTADLIRKSTTTSAKVLNFVYRLALMSRDELGYDTTAEPATSAKVQMLNRNSRIPTLPHARRISWTTRCFTLSIRSLVPTSRTLIGGCTLSGSIV